MNTGDVKVDVYDAAGKLVQSVPATKRKGINRIYWNMRMKPPKTAAGGSKVDFGAAIAPQVHAGRLYIEGQSSRQRISATR